MSIRKSLAWSFSQEFWQKVLQFAGSIVIARLLTPDEVGVFALAMALNYLISSLKSFGIGAYLVRERNITPDKIRTTFGMWLVLSWSIGIIVLLGRHPVAGLYGTPEIAEVLLLVAVSFFITPFGQPARAMLLRQMQLHILHNIGLATVFSSVTCSITLAVLGYSYMSLAWGMVTGTTVGVVLLMAVRPDHLRLRPSLRHWREVASFGGWLSGASMATTFSGEGMKLVLGAMITPAAVALFERGRQIPQITRQALMVPLDRVIFPAFSKDIRAGNSIGPSVEKLVAATTVLLWPAYLSAAILAEPIILLLFGENWRVAGELLPYLVAAAAFGTLLPQPTQILTPHGKVRRLFVLRSFQAVVSLTFAAVGALHSLEMFAMLRIPASAISVLAVLIATRAYLGVGVSAFLPHYLRAGVIAAFCAIPAVSAVVAYGGDVPVLALAGVVTVAPVFWLVAIYATRHFVFAEIDSILRKGASLLRERLGYTH